MSRHLLMLVVVTACHRDRAPSCAEVGERVHGLYSQAVGDVFERRCRNDHWSAAMRSCIRGTTDLAYGRGCRTELTPAQSESLDRDLMPPICNAYEQRLATCPADVRAPLEDQLQAAKRAWLDEDRLTRMCGRAIEAIRTVCQSRQPPPSAR